MKTYQKTPSFKQQLVEVICNKCGKSFTPSDSLFPEFLDIEKDWGYGSQKDGERWEFDLCESCIDEFVGTFKISPLITYD